MNQLKKLDLSRLCSKEERTAELYVFLRGAFPTQPCAETIIIVEELEVATRVECSGSVLAELSKENFNLQRELDGLKGTRADYLAAQSEISYLRNSLNYVITRGILFFTAGCAISAGLTSLLGK